MVTKNKSKVIPEGIVYTNQIMTPDEGYCNYKIPNSQGGQCAHPGTIARNGSIWCEEHAELIQEIRSHIDHTGSISSWTSVINIIILNNIPRNSKASFQNSNIGRDS